MATAWSSSLSGPIPQHPMYSQPTANDYSRPAPRVKPEAASYAKHGITGTVANIFEVTGTSCYASTYKPSTYDLAITADISVP